VLVGGRVQAITIAPDTSGLTLGLVPSGTLARGLVASAGYLGAALVGCVLMAAARVERWAHAILLAMGGCLLLTAVFWVRNLFGFVVVLAWGASLVALGRRGAGDGARFLLGLLAVQVALNATVPWLTWHLVKDLIDRRTAAVAALLVGVLSFNTVYASTQASDAVCTVIFLAGMLCLARADRGLHQAALAGLAFVVAGRSAGAAGGEAGDSREAALAAGMTRLRPVLMTALAMIIGMLPMSLGLGEGGEQNAPLGRAVVGGLVLATFSTLLFVPIVYSVLRKTPPVVRHEEAVEA